MLFGRTEIWPCQILQLRHNSTVDDGSFCVFFSQLEPSLDEIGHEDFNWDQEHFLVVVKRYASHALVLPDLLRPVLMTLNLWMLFQLGQAYDQRDAFLINHAPEVFDGRLQRSLCGNEKLIVAVYWGVDIVRIDVWIIYVFTALNKSYSRVFNYKKWNESEIKLY